MAENKDVEQTTVPNVGTIPKPPSSIGKNPKKKTLIAETQQDSDQDAAKVLDFPLSLRNRQNSKDPGAVRNARAKRSKPKQQEPINNWDSKIQFHLLCQAQSQVESIIQAP